MGILSYRLPPSEPYFQVAEDYDISGSDHALEPLVSDTALAGAFLEWRWAEPMTPKALTLPADTAEQPVFDALHAAWPDEQDGSRCVEFDGFLIDPQMAAATLGNPCNTVAL